MINLLRWLAILVIAQGLALDVTKPLDMAGRQLPKVADFVVKPKSRKDISNLIDYGVSFPKASDKVQDILRVVINHSHNDVGVQPIVYLDIDPRYTAYYLYRYNAIVLRDPQVDNTLNAMDINNINWTSDNQLWAVIVMGHEYGHHIQNMFNKPFDEEEADTFGSYAALKLGCPPELLKAYYLRFAQEMEDTGSSDQGDIGHPDVATEMRNAAANVDHVDELLAAYSS